MNFLGGDVPTIEDDYTTHRAHLMMIFKTRLGVLIEERSTFATAVDRLDVTKHIAANYVAFAALSSQFQNNVPLNGDIGTLGEFSSSVLAMRDLLFRRRLLRKQGEIYYPKNRSIAVYLGGGWLEEYAWAACLEAGADAAVWGQRIRPNGTGVESQQEVDVIAAFGVHLTFISCKALKPYIDKNSKIDQSKARNLKRYLQQAEDLAPFSRAIDDQIIFLTSTDMAGWPNSLNVRVIDLQHLAWDKLVKSIHLPV